MTFPDAKRHYYLGGTFTLIGDHEAARVHATQAMALYEAGPAEQRSYGDEALARLDLTRACLHDGDLDGAAITLAPVLDLPTNQRIKQFDGPMTTIVTALASGPSARDSRAVALHEQITDYRGAGRARALSSRREGRVRYG